jgi:pimeloyl-ACP methyl ester carboxylesterase
MGWEAYSRIRQITAPTMVIHGETDMLIPPANGRLISGRIPHAKLALIPCAGHIFETDQPALAKHAILGFLATQPDRAQASTT